MNAPAHTHDLPAKTLGGHVPDLKLPESYSARQLIGQLVDVRDEGGNRYLLSHDDTHWLLHRRLTPHAPGHARNLRDAATEPIRIPKATAPEP